MRRFWTRIAVTLSLVVAVFLPGLPAAAQATSLPPTTTQCATALQIEGRQIAGCGQARGDEGRVGTYDSGLGRITWGPWQTRLTVQLPSKLTVPAPDGHTGPFIGYPTLADRFGSAVIHGTQYREIQPTDGPAYYVGRRGVYKLSTNLFTPSESWYRTAGCVPSAPCPEWKHEPGKEWSSAG
ncbi:hypothetical protein [Microlunatus sp. GCM10028923]|uniref:hypothetical protein n=1 Tax=Microlunatus sp. GCM10028923 TaxID=3273400 RepID=UPI00360C850A